MTTPRRRRPNPDVPEDFDRALKGYKSFQKLDPTEIGTFAGLTLPKHLYCAGVATFILYRSDKWGEGRHDYIHEHEGGVYCYRPDVARSDGGRVTVPEFVCGAKTLYLLGECHGFGYEGENGPVEAETSKPRPELYAVPSGKALLVIDTAAARAKVLACMWGGLLDVQDVGIVG
jgi:hypothetical protein